MGLRNAPETFMRTVAYLFVDMLYKRLVVFLGDVLIYSATMEEQFKLLEKVFTRLHKHCSTAS